MNVINMYCKRILIKIIIKSNKVKYLVQGQEEKFLEDISEINKTPPIAGIWFKSVNLYLRRESLGSQFKKFPGELVLWNLFYCV